MLTLYSVDDSCSKGQFCNDWYMVLWVMVGRHIWYIEVGGISDQGCICCIYWGNLLDSFVCKVYEIPSKRFTYLFRFIYYSLIRCYVSSVEYFVRALYCKACTFLWYMCAYMSGCVGLRVGVCVSFWCNEFEAISTLLCFSLLHKLTKLQTWWCNFSRIFLPILGSNHVSIYLINWNICNWRKWHYWFNALTSYHVL